MVTSEFKDASYSYSELNHMIFCLGPPGLIKTKSLEIYQSLKCSVQKDKKQGNGEKDLVGYREKEGWASIYEWGRGWGEDLKQ